MRHRVVARPGLTRKELLLADLTGARQEIMDAAASVSPRQEEQVFLGDWCLRDLVAHLIGWDYTNRDAAEDILGGQVPAFYELRDSDWHSLNYHFVQKFNKGSWSDLLDSARQSQQALIGYLETIPDADLFNDFGVRHAGIKVTIARLLAAEAKDEKKHAAQIREWLR